MRFPIALLWHVLYFHKLSLAQIHKRWFLVWHVSVQVWFMYTSWYFILHTSRSTGYSKSVRSATRIDVTHIHGHRLRERNIHWIDFSWAQYLILSIPNKFFRLWSHKGILYTVSLYAIRYTICSPPQTTFKWCSVEGAESGLWWKANHIVYSEYRIQYTPMWLQPYWVLLHQSWLSNTAWIPPIPEVHCNWYRLLLISWCHRLSVIFCSYPSFFFFHHWKWNF